ncbi:MAG: TerD family protein, partial [Gordonia sp. (in: high G+C Gram-positive bacteria)]|jgi:stress response protein SCP2|nr:TerD family protein [Gordonia sp. (in: high G+C Gram-positive bacteria)]
VISVDLAAIPPHVDRLAFIVTSYRGQTFAEVQNAYCRLIDQTTNAELARYTLAGGMPFTGVCMAVVSRINGEWQLRAVGEGFNAKTANKAIPHVMPYLA